MHKLNVHQSEIQLQQEGTIMPDTVLSKALGKKKKKCLDKTLAEA